MGDEVVMPAPMLNQRLRIIWKREGRGYLKGSAQMGDIWQRFGTSHTE